MLVVWCVSFFNLKIINKILYPVLYASLLSIKDHNKGYYREWFSRVTKKML